MPLVNLLRGGVCFSRDAGFIYPFPAVGY